MKRRHLLLGAGALAIGFSHPAWASNPAEAFVSSNVQAGFAILNDPNASADQRRTRFAAFLLGLTDVRRVALFMLGRYAQGASPADLDAYVAAYQDHAEALYQSYFARYAGQTLRVIASRERAPGDFIVTTNITGNSAAPMEVDFRVKTDGTRPLLLDIGIAGVWLAPAQQAEFLAVLSQNNGDINALSAHLRTAQAR
jgi:phospholipid transport system substrate-binding protein